MKRLFSIMIVIILCSTTLYGQQKKEIKKVDILTSAVCDMCAITLEKAMLYEKGVKKSKLDLESKVFTIWYRTDKTSEEVLRKAVSDLGYDADSVKADTSAYDNLDPCCKKGEHD